jgi:ATP-dependent protease ClpP protease subunit
MPTWGDLLLELQQTSQILAQQVQAGLVPPTTSAFDLIRRKYLASLAQKDGRAVILYASKWTQFTLGLPPEFISITAEDVQGFMEVMHGLPVENGLDLVIHLPGGSGEAAEALVSYVRSKFDDVRVLVPHAAMSAATMLACAGDQIVLGKHSFLGPIDPQFIIQTELGRASVAAHAIEEQFIKAKEEISKDQKLLAAWVPIIRQYGPALIVQCQLARELSETLVADWLTKYMFSTRDESGKRVPDQSDRGKEIAKKLADHSHFKSHSRFIDREKAREFGLTVTNLEADQDLQERTLSVFHATSHTFNATPLCENN